MLSYVSYQIDCTKHITIKTKLLLYQYIQIYIYIKADSNFKISFFFFKFTMFIENTCVTFFKIIKEKKLTRRIFGVNVEANNYFK